MIIKRLINKILEHYLPLDKQAIRAGVVMGSGNEIESAFWKPAEPYLIEIGSNCQITHDVKFFTHGGGKF